MAPLVVSAMSGIDDQNEAFPRSEREERHPVATSRTMSRSGHNLRKDKCDMRFMR